MRTQKHTLNRLLFIAGAISTVMFILTGIYMRLNIASINPSDEKIRMMFRANHLYILLTGLTNLSMSFALAVSKKEKEKYIQITAALLSLTSSVTLIIAFFIDPITGSMQRDITRFSLIAFLIGTALNLILLKINERKLNE